MWSPSMADHRVVGRRPSARFPSGFAKAPPEGLRDRPFVADLVLPPPVEPQTAPMPTVAAFFVRVDAQAPTSHSAAATVAVSRLVLFTEFKDTLDYLVERLAAYLELGALTGPAPAREAGPGTPGRGNE